MAHRTFIDPAGFAWDVWEVHATLGERRRARQSKAPATGERRVRQENRVAMGTVPSAWLVFESTRLREKRRLRPIPDDWEHATDAELDALRQQAKPALNASRRLIE
jgi:hypothetical protein